MFALLVVLAAAAGIIVGIVLVRSASRSRLSETLLSQHALLSAAVAIVVASTLGRWTGTYGHGFSDFAYLAAVVVVGMNIGRDAWFIHRGFRRLNRQQIDDSAQQ